MILYNQSQKTILSKDLKEAISLLDKFFGLLIKSNSRTLLFKTRFGIHTFFLKDTIDVLVLDQSSQVVKTQTVKPNSIFLYNPIYQIIIELPQNAIKKSKTKIGDKLEIKKELTKRKRKNPSSTVAKVQF
jgi:hypothetical protein